MTAGPAARAASPRAARAHTPSLPGAPAENRPGRPRRPPQRPSALRPRGPCLVRHVAPAQRASALPTGVPGPGLGRREAVPARRLHRRRSLSPRLPPCLPPSPSRYILVIYIYIYPAFSHLLSSVLPSLLTLLLSFPNALPHNRTPSPARRPMPALFYPSRAGSGNLFR